MRNRNEQSTDNQTGKAVPQRPRDDQNDRERRSGAQQPRPDRTGPKSPSDDPARDVDDDEMEDVEDIEDARQDPPE